MARFLLAFVAVLALATAAQARVSFLDDLEDGPAPAPAPAPPAFCFGLDCPEYELVENTTYYEVRNYKKSTWVSTQVTSPAMAAAMGMSFGRLLPYFGGLNSNGTAIPQGNPTRISSSAIAPMYTMNTYTVGVFLPFNLSAATAPAPILPGIYIEEIPAFTAYVVVTPKKVIDEFSLNVLLTAFKANLTAAGITPPTGFTVATYKAPKTPKTMLDFEDLDKKAPAATHNEVWLVDGLAAATVAQAL